MLEVCWCIHIDCAFFHLRGQDCFGLRHWVSLEKPECEAVESIRDSIKVRIRKYPLSIFLNEVYSKLDVEELE